jgi:hypothetical protein
MPDRQPVIAYIRHDGADEKRQERLIVKFCNQHDLDPVARAATPQAAAQAVAAGAAAGITTVIAVSDRRDGLRHLVRVAGGDVRFIRAHERMPSLRDWLGRAVGRGATPSDIGRLVGEDTTDIRQLLRDLGLDRPKGE